MGQTSGNLFDINIGLPAGGSSDIFAARIKLGKQAASFIWATQLGAEVVGQVDPSGFEDARDVALDEMGNVYIAGTTNASFAGPNTGPGGQADMIVVSLDGGTGELLGATQLGSHHPAIIDSSWGEHAWGIAAGGGAVYVAGSTQYAAFGGPNMGATDAVVVKLDTGLTTVDWVRQVGTASYDTARTVTIHPNGDVTAFINTVDDLYGPNAGGDDLAAIKLSSAGLTVGEYQHGLGPSGGSAAWDDRVFAATFDAISDRVLAVGETGSGLAPELWEAAGEGDAFFLSGQWICPEEAEEEECEIPRESEGESRE